MCWGDDFTWKEGAGWNFRVFSGTKWNKVGNAEKKDNIRNTYRGLMSRARDSLVIWVPPGEEGDATPLTVGHESNCQLSEGLWCECVATVAGAGWCGRRALIWLSELSR